MTTKSNSDKISLTGYGKMRHNPHPPMSFQLNFLNSLSKSKKLVLSFQNYCFHHQTLPNDMRARMSFQLMENKEKKNPHILIHSQHEKECTEGKKSIPQNFFSVQK